MRYEEDAKVGENLFEEYKDVVTIKELCVMLQIGRTTAYELIRSESIKSIKIGKQIRIPKHNIINYVYHQNSNKMMGNQLAPSNKYDIIGRSQ